MLACLRVTVRASRGLDRGGWAGDGTEGVVITTWGSCIRAGIFIAVVLSLALSRPSATAAASSQYALLSLTCGGQVRITNAFWDLEFGIVDCSVSYAAQGTLASQGSVPATAQVNWLPGGHGTWTLERLSFVFDPPIAVEPGQWTRLTNECLTGTVVASSGFSQQTSHVCPSAITFEPPPPAPTLALPASFTSYSSSSSGTAITYSATATEHDGSALDPICQPASGSLFLIGATTVTCSVTGAGGTVSGAFTVTVALLSGGALSVGPGTTAVIDGATVSGSTSVAGDLTLTSGTINGPVSVGPGGSLTLEGGTVSGPLTIQSGGSLTIENATVTGPVKGTPTDEVRLCGATINAPLTLASGTARIVIGDPANGCAGNTITGKVTITANTGGGTFLGNKTGAAVQITGNSGGWTVGANSYGGNANVSNNN